MSKYILLENSRVVEIIPETDPLFPTTPMENRFTKAFIQSLIEVEDSVEVSLGMIYDLETHSFYIEEGPSSAELLSKTRFSKIEYLSEECNAAITSGIDVETTQGTEHFSLEETDQINLTSATTAIQQGATEYPYHADGQLCRMFSAEEIIAIGNAAIKHKLYHTTLCNHLMTWARRAESAEELNTITYSTDNLPEDLLANMNSILSTVQ